MVQSIKMERNAQLSLLEKLVNINSGTMNVAGVHQVGEILRREFIQLGFNTEWHSLPFNMKRGGTLIATRSGHKGKRLLLIGHLDTVFPLNSPFKQAIRRKNTLTGPGVIDDKGGDVVILYALKALKKAGALNDVSITVVLTGDEENSGKPTAISRKPLLDAAARHDIALDFESGIAHTATIARRGVSHWELKTTGKEAHSSQIFLQQSGDGAIYEITRILHSIRTQFSSEKYFSFNPAWIVGGTNIHADKNKSSATVSGEKNVIAKTAMATGDMRFLTPAQKIRAEKKLAAIVKQHLPGTSASMTFQEGIPSMPPTARNLVLLREYSELSEALGYGKIKPLQPGLRGAGDISYAASLVKASLAGLGPFGEGGHSIKETLEIPSLSMQTERAAILIYRLTRG